MLAPIENHQLQNRTWMKIVFASLQHPRLLLTHSEKGIIQTNTCVAGIHTEIQTNTCVPILFDPIVHTEIIQIHV